MYARPRNLALLTMLGLFHCTPKADTEAPLEDGSAAETEVEAAAAKVEVFRRPALLLSQAHFARQLGPDGKSRPVPQPARIRWVSEQEDGSWHTNLVEDKESIVFHKAICLEDGNLLTIGGTEAHLKTWKREGEGWTGQSHWNPKFGGKFDRLRDIEVGDVDGDGDEDFIIATHDQGVIAVLDKLGDEPKTIWERATTFVHEIELMDLDGDGKVEIFATPSEPNSAKGSQGGEVIMLKHGPKGFAASTVVKHPSRHAKEIYAHEGILWVSLEAKAKGIGSKAQEEEALEIQAYAFNAKGNATMVASHPIPGGLQARVVQAGRPTKSNSDALVVTTWKGGIHLLSGLDSLTSKKPELQGTLIDAESAGFEHAATWADLDGDGADELYVTAEENDTLSRYTLSEGNWKKEVLSELGKTEITWSIDVCR